MENNIAISVKNLSKTYNLYNKPADRLKESLSFIRHKSYHKNFNALDDISFDIKKGECFGIIGKNGSGKSTTLKILTGVLNQTSGSVDINGKISALLELGAGFDLDYTGIQNIYFNGTIVGLTKAEVEKRIPLIEEFADIGDFINQPVKTYSSGMFARLAFAVAINIDPDILIVDEALSVGDIFFQSKCYKKFDEFKQQGKTILFVTHDMSAVLKYCDRAALLNNGKLVTIDKPDVVVNQYKKILSNISVEQKDEEVSKSLGGHKMCESLALNNNPSVYGNGSADIIDFGIVNSKNEITNTIYQNEDVTFKMIVKFNNDVDNPIFAWKIKNRKGLEIMGTNTLYEGIDFGHVKKGTCYSIEFKTKLPLTVDQYLVDFGCTRFDGDNLEVLQRKHEITTVDILSSRQNVGFVNPMCQIVYKTLEK